ncbi:hypothetical protein [Desulfosporosinus nitroreducens]|uniref:SurA N-terminal domain-containing protein n=1 Tax=Desulfosporosinus nitroreducens TaxID=2018668 RepID=A0ABT8QMU7_9FIRM|nr:hypothetical protein [Desulfosporosinus nitroreducens]MDO0822654.1 SurA N-terminal domain-containing protein [Desulfosporosinus nitroreducens]
MGCMKALRKGVQTRIIAIPFGLALIPFTIWGILEFFNGNRDYFGLVILIISPALVYFGTANKLGDVQIQIEKENKRFRVYDFERKLNEGHLNIRIFNCSFVSMCLNPHDYTLIQLVG